MLLGLNKICLNLVCGETKSISVLIIIRSDVCSGKGDSVDVRTGLEIWPSWNRTADRLVLGSIIKDKSGCGWHGDVFIWKESSVSALCNSGNVSDTFCNKLHVFCFIYLQRENLRDW